MMKKDIPGVYPFLFLVKIYIVLLIYGNKEIFWGFLKTSKKKVKKRIDKRERR